MYLFPNKDEWAAITSRPVTKDDVGAAVAAILRDVQSRGDEAVMDYTAKFGGPQNISFEVTEEEIATAIHSVDEELKRAIDLARNNIEKFHAAQKEEGRVIETMPGVSCWRRSLPIERVGLYIPGGTAPLFSTLLMLGIPATIAGCEEIIITTPPDKNGNIDPVILYTAQLLGIKKIFKVGGAQAIAALAYGTETIPAVVKIFGPGNAYVTRAKQIVNGEGVAIDMPAGPSEVAIYADESCDPSFVAADLLSQAEHGADSQVILVAASAAILKNVQQEISDQIKKLPRMSLAGRSLANSRMVVLDIEEAFGLLNMYAPEHLIIASDNADELAKKVRNAGSVFLGHLTPESAGDYASGTNHTLPTGGFAKAYSGVSLDSFVKKITFQRISEKALGNIGPAVEIMARAEGLEAHRNAITLRLKKITDGI